MFGPKLQFEVDTTIAITGGKLSATLDGIALENNQHYTVAKGAILSFGRFSSGCRAYLGVKGGFKTELILGSRSMYPGITSTSYLKKGAILKINGFISSSSRVFSRVKVDESYLSDVALEVYKGPEFEALSSIEKEQLFAQSYTVSKYNNRMGYQVEELLPNNLKSIITSPVLPGTVQLTASGQLIILMRDCQTTGGYPRVLQLTEKAIDILAQKPTGAAFNFVPV